MHWHVKTTFWFFVLIISLLVGTVSFAQEWTCEYEGANSALPWDGDTGKKDGTNPIVVKAIFVRFPSTRSDQRTITPNHRQALDNLETLLHKQSLSPQGYHNIQYEIVTIPESDPNEMWEMPKPSGDYGSSIVVSGWPPIYDNYWGGDSGRRFNGELQGEVFRLIQDTYDLVYPGGWNSPFTGADGIIFIYKPDDLGADANPISRGSDIGGYGELSLQPNVPELSRILDGAPTVVHSDTGEILLFGHTIIWWNGEIVSQNTVSTGHEWGHALGLNHDPEGAGSGAYTIMRGIWPGWGYPSYPIFSHQSRVQLGWHSAQVVEQNLKNLELLDINISGSIYKIPIGHAEYLETPDAPFEIYAINSVVDEYFLIAYEEGGVGYGAPDTGLFVWHIIDQKRYAVNDIPGVWDAGDLRTSLQYLNDMEIPTGLFADPSVAEAENYWQIPDPYLGYDSMDNFIDVATGYNREDRLSYMGSTDDLFNWGEAVEFSYRGADPVNLNPFSFGYDLSQIDLTGIPYFDFPKHTEPQLNPNSIKIEILGQVEHGVLVNILLAPFEAIVAPSGGETLQAGDPFNIQWATTETTNIQGGIIDLVDIYFTTGDGNDDILIATAVDATLGQHTWTPTGEHVTGSGQIRLIFHNINDADHVGEDLSDGVFSVTGPSVFYRPPAFPGDTGLDYSGTPYSVVEWDFLNTGDETKDIFISISDEPSMFYQGTGISPEGIPLFEGTQPSGFHALADLPQSGLRGLAVSDIGDGEYPELFAAHADKPRLYRVGDLDGKIYDAAAGLGLDISASHSISGTWGFFDGDRYPDLFVNRTPGYVEDPPYYPVVDLATNGSILLTNSSGSGAEGRVFSPTPSSGLPANLGSQTASWCDFDGDNDMDLFIGSLLDNGSGASRLYRNVNSSFTEVTSLLQSTAITMVTACAWADMNGDKFLDLVLTRHDQAAAIYFNDGVGNFSNGHGGLAPFLLGTSDGFSGLVLYDFDLDGDLDFLGLSNSDLRSPILFDNNTVAGFTPQFEDITVAVGLDDLGYVHGALALDFGNAIGEKALPDLFLGRPTANGKFYFKGEPVGAVSGNANHFVSVRLESDTATDNSLGIGATVKVTSGSITQIRLVDGGSMRGSQSSRDLMFGLGDYQGPISATVIWPSGIEQTDVPLVMDQINVISLAEIQVNDSSVVGKYIVQASGLVDWQIKWDVNILGDAQFNEVIFNMASIPSQCQPEEASITLASNDVELNVSAKASGGFTIVITWRNRPCVPRCKIPFRVKSGNSQQTDTSDSDKNLKVKVCIGN